MRRIFVEKVVFMTKDPKLQNDVIEGTMHKDIFETVVLGCSAHGR